MEKPLCKTRPKSGRLCRFLLKLEVALGGVYRLALLEEHPRSLWSSAFGGGGAPSRRRVVCCFSGGPTGGALFVCCFGFSGAKANPRIKSGNSGKNMMDIQELREQGGFAP